MSKKRKRSANALEDDEMNQKLRDGRPVKRNARQEKELAQLQEGTHYCLSFIKIMFRSNMLTCVDSAFLHVFSILPYKMLYYHFFSSH